MYASSTCHRYSFQRFIPHPLGIYSPSCSFLLLHLLSFAEVRFYDQFSFLKTPRCTKIKTRLLGLTRMSTKSQKMKKTVEEQLSKGCLTGTRGYVIYSPGTTPGEHVTYPRGIGK